jgi:CheY-like chemotaxis protein
METKPITKILLIEDEAILRGELAEWLTFEGYDVIDAEDGVVGVEYASRKLPDLIISDITMPRAGYFARQPEIAREKRQICGPLSFGILPAISRSEIDNRQGEKHAATDHRLVRENA